MRKFIYQLNRESLAAAVAVSRGCPGVNYGMVFDSVTEILRQMKTGIIPVDERNCPIRILEALPGKGYQCVLVINSRRDLDREAGAQGVWDV